MAPPGKPGCTLMRVRTETTNQEELGEYRSAGCVRQSPGQAAALYEWADEGTLVVVLP